MVRFASLMCALVMVAGFHDCIQPSRGHRLPPGFIEPPPSNCSGGLCVGMHGGPHEGGPSSYPVGNEEEGYTWMYSTMTVPKLPEKQDGICYYIWTDIFFGDMSYGRMNQFVPQLILGNALDGSSGPPDYKPSWGLHTKWSFAAHYFFEVFNPTKNGTDSHAAYGKLYSASEGETLYTSFQVRPSTEANAGPVWTLEMGVIGDASRTSTVVAEQPYMGIGANWPVPTTSWAELNYTNMCVNSCWELYGANDPAHLPGSGSKYDIMITTGNGATKPTKPFPWVTQWDEDEGAGKSCASSSISEHHNDTVQHVLWNIGL